ncbi:MAG: hypothetical protein V1686_00540 [Patescibacteria group bacterium]
MAIKTIEEKKKQQKLLIVAGIMFLAAFIILYFGVLKKGGNVAVDTSTPQPGQEIIDTNQQSSILLEQKLKNIDLNFDFLNSNILPFLKTHGELPVKKGETGRSNPFIVPQQ